MISKNKTGRVRWGVVGVGDIARRTVADMKLVGNADVVGVTSRTQVAAHEYARQWSIPTVFSSYTEMLMSSDIDVVYICTPHDSHFELSKAALLAGKHVLCEKPMTLRAAETIELAVLAAHTGLFLMEAMWMRFNPAILEIHRRIRSGVIGEIGSLHASFGVPFPRTEGSRIWTYERGGGAILDLGVYPIAFADIFLGEPDLVDAHGVMDGTGIDRSETIYLRYPREKSASISSSITSYTPANAWIGGSHGYITIEAPFYAPAQFRLFETSSTASGELVSVPHEGAGYTHMFRAVSDAIQEGRPDTPLNPMSATISVMRTVDRVREILTAAG